MRVLVVYGTSQPWTFVSTLARSMILGALNPSEGHAPIDNWVTSVSERLSMLEAKIGPES